MNGLTHTDFAWDDTQKCWIDPMIEAQVTETIGNLLDHIRSLEEHIAHEAKVLGDFALWTINR